jgi:hypothetical protein
MSADIEFGWEKLASFSKNQSYSHISMLARNILLGSKMSRVIKRQIKK